jgi:hypothetical protein
MALISNEKWMSIIMLIAIILITLLLESYSWVIKSEGFSNENTSGSANNKIVITSKKV